MQETWVRSLGWEDPLEKEMAIHSRTIAWKIPWTEEPGRLQSMGSQRVGHDWVTSLTHSLTHSNYGGGNKDNGNLLQKVPCRHCYTQCPHTWSRPLSTQASAKTPGHSRPSLGQSLVGSLLLSPGSWCVEGSVCALQESVSPVLCKFWRLYGGVNGNLFQEGLCHTRVCCTQSPCPCSSPLLTRTSTGDTQTWFCLSLCGVSGSWCAQGLFEPSEHLWQVIS